MAKRQLIVGGASQMPAAVKKLWGSPPILRIGDPEVYWKLAAAMVQDAKEAARPSETPAVGIRKRRPRGQVPSAAPAMVEVRPATATAQGEGRVNDAVSWHIDKTTLPLSEPRRYRDRAHLQFVAAQPCLVCGRSPSDPHHLRFMQPRALGRRVSDEFAVPLCRTHHRALHRRGDEPTWWMSVDLDPVAVAQRLWHQTRVCGAALERTEEMRSRVRGRRASKGSGYRGAAPFGMGSPPKP
jgi:hypothetical protein